MMMSSGIGAVFFFLAGILVLGLVYLVGWVVLNLVRGLVWVLKSTGRLAGKAVVHVSRFARREVVDALHTAGALLTAGVMAPLALMNTLMGRWGQARHYGGAIEDELGSAARGLYRLAIGNPVRLLGLSVLTDGVERRLPRTIDRAPHSASVRDARAFEGYEVCGSLPPGGSGARLYIARPLPEKLHELRRKGHADPGQVVIKSFAVDEGSTLPQIVRETRALEAASRLGLVLEHQLTPTRFHYVMPFVPGEDLGLVTARMHAKASPEGLDRRRTSEVLGYAMDILRSLRRFHEGGLWHKDIKPTNLIVSRGQVQLVDLGLVTPLQSAMTLTTHGTEYYRDPEMVRLALRGVKVHEVDGVKFDLYSVGAVLYSMIENSFPAHGSLSRITKSCPQALQWIVRRSMADMATRYASAAEMLADLEAVAAAKDAHALRPADLPSVRDELCAADAGSPARGYEPVHEGPGVTWDHGGTGGARRFDGRESPAGVGSPAAWSPGARVSPGLGRRRRRGRVLATLAAMALGSVALGSLIASRLEQSYEPGAFARRTHGPAPRLSMATAPGSSAHRQSPGASRAGARRLGAGDHSPEADRLEEQIARLQQEWQRDLAPVLERHGRGKAREEVRDGKLPGLLVLETMGTSLDAAQREALGRAVREHGLSILGSPLDETPLGEVDRLIAGGLHAVGLGDPEDGDSIDRLQGYLDGSSELAGIFWLGAADGGQRPVARLLLRSSQREPEPAIQLQRLASHAVELR